MSNDPGDRLLTEHLDALRRDVAALGDESPPPILDAAVLARARAAVRPARTVRRWWVPASVAATVVIAFSLVMRVQQESGVEPAGAPVPAREAGMPAEADAPAAADEAAATAADEQVASPAAEQPAVTTMEGARREAAPLPAAPGEATAAMAAPEVAPAADAALGEAAPQPALKATRAAPMAAAQSLPSPEAWLARIEALEAEGKLEQAAAERERLEAAYPGWLAARLAGQE